MGEQEALNELINDLSTSRGAHEKAVKEIQVTTSKGAHEKAVNELQENLKVADLEIQSF